MMSYNEYRYELMVSEGAFNFSDDGQKLKEGDFHFGKYLKYAVFDWLQVLGCCELDWADCKQVAGTCEEANHHLDVSLLFKKLQHHERSIEYLLSEKEELCLYLTEPPSLSEAIKKRRLAQYYDKVIKGQPAMTLEDVRPKDKLDEILQLGLEKSKT